MKKNNSNDASKRTENQINSILRSQGIKFKATNEGDGRKFSIPDASLKTRIAIKKAGFILLRSIETDATLYFVTH